MGTYEKMVELVKNWDPFQMGPEFYETEASDVVYVVSAFDDPKYIAKKYSIFTLCHLKKSHPLRNVRN